MNLKIRKTRRAKRLSVTVGLDGAVAIAAPIRTSDRAIRSFLEEHAEWIAKALIQMEQKDVIRLPRTEREYLINKPAARNMLRKMLKQFAPLVGVTFGAVRVKNMRRTWGSCATGGDLNFNYKLVYLPQSLAEYVVVHELCHRLEFNHSKAFWDHVARVLPDWKARRKEIKKYLP